MVPCPTLTIGPPALGQDVGDQARFPHHPPIVDLDPPAAVALFPNLVGVDVGMVGDEQSAQPHVLQRKMQVAWAVHLARVDEGQIEGPSAATSEGGSKPPPAAPGPDPPRPPGRSWRGNPGGEGIHLQGDQPAASGQGARQPYPRGAGQAAELQDPPRPRWPGPEDGGVIPESAFTEIGGSPSFTAAGITPRSTSSSQAERLSPQVSRSA